MLISTRHSMAQGTLRSLWTSPSLAESPNLNFRKTRYSSRRVRDEAAMRRMFAIGAEYAAATPCSPGSKAALTSR